MGYLDVFRFVIVVLLGYFRCSEGHGHLLDPPARSSMWREGFNTPKNYNDNALNCGGYYTHWALNDGKCGVCGDPYQSPQPRDNESGGRYGKGIVTRTYQAGQEVTFKVLITANHVGWFEFRMCPDGSPTTPVTQSCLDRYVLQMADGSGTRYDLGKRYNTVSVKVKLPDAVTCKQCVIQWKWHAANSYGTDDQGVSCKGCGAQEEFYGCADVAITTSGQPNNPGPAAPITVAPQNTPRPVFTFRPPAITAAPQNTPRPVYTFPPLTNRPTNAPVTSAPWNTPVPVTSAPWNTPVPVTSAPWNTPVPVTSAPWNTPVPYLTFPPATYRPVVTNAPTNPQTPRPAYQTFRPVSFPYFTTAPPPATTKPTRTQAPGSGIIPTGFVPISVKPGFGTPTNAPPMTPARTPLPTTVYPFFRPPTTAAPKINTRAPLTLFPTRPQPVATTRPPFVLPTNFFRPRTTARPRVTFTPRPQTTPRPILTARPTQPTTKPTTNKPLVFTVVKRTTTSPPPTTRIQTPIPTTPRPGIWTMSPQRTPAPTQPPTRAPQINRCFGINSWRGVPELDTYCNAQCQMVGGSCPASFCACTLP